MQLPTVLLLILALVFAVLLVYFQYFFKSKKHKSKWLLATLRFVSIFTILLLLINPKFEKKSYTTMKPKLLVAIDNSASISFSKRDTLVRKLLDKIKQNKKLNNKFDVQLFTFGTSLQSESNIDFNEKQTNIYEAVKGLNAIAEDQVAPIILLSDGNQTYGNSYAYYKSKQPVYPITIGDVLTFDDIEITQINVNKYTYLDNTFPVEVFINYTGKQAINSKFIVKKGNQIVFSQKLSLSKDKKSVHIPFKLPSNLVGRHIYKASVEPFEGEKNTVNNDKNFRVEVVDEQTQVAIVYDVLHPDIAMLHRVIKSNKQRKVNLINLNDIKNKASNNDVYILYQPNKKFEKIFNQIIDSNKNYFIITGKSTDWNFLNQMQNDFRRQAISASENYFPTFNTNFNTFYTEDIGFSDFTPLEDAFGEIVFSSPYQTILSQNINGLETENPLLVILSSKSRRQVILFGENSWKWRLQSYKEQQSFETFDRFFNHLIQYLTITKKSTPITLDYASLYYANDLIQIRAKTYDKTLNFDTNANLELQIEGDKKTIPFYLKKGFYEVEVPNLKSGDYHFTVKNSRNLNRVSGTFTITDYIVEHELMSVNIKDMQSLAVNANGKLFEPNAFKTLLNELNTNKKFVSVQKENKIKISFIDWKWIIGLFILSLSVEWLIRKYRGLV